MSAHVPDTSDDTADEATKFNKAQRVRDEMMERLDDVYGVVDDGFEPDEDDLEALADLPDEDLHDLEQLAEEYAENVRDDARAARKARELKARRSQGS